MGVKKLSDDHSTEEMIRHEVESQLNQQMKKLQVLEKLDILKDEKTIKALRGLENIDWLQQRWKPFLVRNFICLFLDFIKVLVLVGVGTAAVLYTVPTGHLARILPVLGYGDGARVNAGLSLLSHEVSAKDFEKYFNNVIQRVDREIIMFYDLDNRFPGQFEYSLLEDLYAYDYIHAGVDLKLKIRTDMGNKLNAARTDFMSSYDYDMELGMKDGALKEDLEKLRSFKIFASQGRFVQGLTELKNIKEPSKLKSFRHAIKWAFHQSYLDYKNELHEWIGKNL